MNHNISAETAREAARDRATGQFGTQPHDEAGQVLLPGSVGWRDRVGRLVESGRYVEPVVAHTFVDPATAAGREGWWAQGFASAEYGQADGDYPQMPDDNTPSMGAGRSLSGHRRTHRMAYSGSGVTLRMPSATAVKRYARQAGCRTFDVPVSVESPYGRVQGWVRVCGGPQGWSARALGVDGDTGAYLGESVAAVLAARRPTRALVQAGDLIERRKAREAAEGVLTHPLSSSWIEGLGYDGGSRTMVMTTRSGGRYGFAMSRVRFNALTAGYSPGRAFNQLVKGHAPAVPVTQCEVCGRFTSTAVRHRCPVLDGPRGGERFGHNEAARIAAAHLYSRTVAAPRRVGDGGRAAVVGGPAGDAGVAPPAGWGAHRVVLGRQTRVPEWMQAVTRRELTAGRFERGGHTLGVGRGYTALVALDLERHAAQGYVPDAYDQDCANGSTGRLLVDGVDASTAAVLLRRLPVQALDHSRGGEPTLGSVLRAVRTNPGVVEVGGFLVPPSRRDEALVVDHVFLFVVAGSAAQAEWRARMLGLSAGRRPGGVEAVRVPWRPGERAWRFDWR